MRVARAPIFLLVACAALAGCDGKQEEKPRQEVTTNNEANASQLLLDAIQQRPVEGGAITIRPSPLVLLEVDQGGRVESNLTLFNSGDSPIKIKEIRNPDGAQSSITLTGKCMNLETINRANSCDLKLIYQDRTGRASNSLIIVETDSKRTPTIQINVRVDIRPPPTPVQPPAPPPTPQRSQNQDAAYMQALANAQGARRQMQSNLSPSAFTGGVGSFARPDVVTRSQDPRYDPDQIPWTETSLPVDRKRILTQDRIITATLETPVSSLMCNQVIAVVDRDVFSPDNMNVLIPHGTRAIGHCDTFKDERINIQWFRLITPRGVNITFNKLLADTGDHMGRGGVPGAIQERKFDRYVAPFLQSGIDLLSVGARAAFGKDQSVTVNPMSGSQTQTNSRWDAAIDDFNGRARDTIQNSIKGLLDQRRSVTVPPGSRIEIQIQEDIYFKSPSQVVKLADYEYEIRKNPRNPQAVEGVVPPMDLIPKIDGNTRGNNTVQIGGRTYTIQPAAQGPENRTAAPGTDSTQRGGMHQGVSNDSGFYQTPQYASPNQLPPRNQTGGYGGYNQYYNGSAGGYNSYSNGYQNNNGLAPGYGTSTMQPRQSGITGTQQGINGIQ